VLAKFSVTNFKGFKEKFTLELDNPNGYNFNTESIKNGIVNNAIIYGKNGVGKSNLGLAIIDIIGHLTDNSTDENEYKPYLNAFNGLNNTSYTASFYYEFHFGEDIVIYKYEKTSVIKVVTESLLINGKELARIDRQISNEAIIKIKGAETLKRELNNKNLSLLKYIRNNTTLDLTPENETLKLFFQFVDGMLFFKSLTKSLYMGFESTNKNVLDYIVEKDKVQDFEAFLNKAGIDCKLVAVNGLVENSINFSFDDRKIPFHQVASTGTKSLTLIYYWLLRLRENAKISFLFIDEYDAFYHHDLSRTIIEELIKTGVQFILTTHNSSNISNDLLRPDCYFIMKKDSIKSLVKSTVKELREAHNIGKMYRAGSFND